MDNMMDGVREEGGLNPNNSYRACLEQDLVGLLDLRGKGDAVKNSREREKRERARDDEKTEGILENESKRKLQREEKLDPYSIRGVSVFSSESKKQSRSQRSIFVLQ